MSTAAKSLYFQLVAEMPTLGGTAPITPEINCQLGQHTGARLAI